MSKKCGIAICSLSLLLGVTLYALNAAGLIDDFWSNLGAVLTVVGISRLIQVFRLYRDVQYREKTETSAADERLIALRSKAWAWAGRMFVTAAAIASVLLRINAQEALSTAIALAACLLIVLYWGAYVVLMKKY